MQSTNLIDKLILRFKQINYWLLILPMVALVVMFAVDAANVATIRLFGIRATPTQKELIEEMLIIAVYVGMAYVLLGPGHIKTGMLKDRLGRRLRFASEMVGDTATLAFAAFTTWATTSGAMFAITRGSKKMGDVELALSPYFVIMAVSFGLFTIAALLLMIQHILYFKHPPKEEAGVTPSEQVLKEGVPGV